ncbi:MAG: TMEM165/GDT1 family protein [Thermoplasmata archaeon]
MLGSALYGFAIVVAVVGGLELVDRTSFALIALSARARPGPTWAGGAVAFVLSTAIAVSAGAALATALGPHHVAWLRIGGGAFLIGYALWLYFRGSAEEIGAEERTLPSVFLAAFLTVFLLELGDTTMIFEIVFVADYGWLVVLAAGSLALVGVAVWDVALGHRLGARVSPPRLRALVTVVMLGVGALTIAYGLFPGLFGFV